jgi:hypothetical protein
MGVGEGFMRNPARGPRPNRDGPDYDLQLSERGY